MVNGKNGYMTCASEGGQAQRREDERIFAGKLMDILEKKELPFLRQGAFQSACGYQCFQIARQAENYYRAALWSYGEKKNRFSRNHLADVIY